MYPILIDYKLIEKEINLKPKVKAIPLNKEVLINDKSTVDGGIFTFNFFINIFGILSIFIGLYILNYRKIHKERNREEYEYKVKNLFRKVNDMDIV